MVKRKTIRRLNRDLVVCEAAQLCDDVGVERLSLSVLADRLGVRPPSLYNHIASLDDLYTQLTIKGFAELLKIIEEAIATNPEQPSKSIARATRQFAKEHPTLFYYTTQGIHLSKPDRKRYGEKLINVTAQAYLGSKGSTNKNRLAEYLIRCLVYGFIILERNGGLEPEENIDKLYDDLIDIADVGIRSVVSE